MIVSQGEDHPALYQDDAVITQVSWIGRRPGALPYRCKARVRYRQEEEPCEIVEIADDRVAVRFDQPQRAVTPRQSLVFYQGDECLGGGMIEGVY